MLHLQLSPEIEARVQAEAGARGIAAESYVAKLVESALRAIPAECQRPLPADPPHRTQAQRNLKAFFRVMAAHSDELPRLPDEAFTRDSFYQDHD